MLLSKISIKKYFINSLILMILISFISISCFKVDIYADQESTKTAKNLDVVLVMDKSGSMTISDPNRTSIEASKMFIDMLKKSGANVSIVEFGDDASSEGMVSIKDKSDKKKLKDTLQGIEFVDDFTDTGAALVKATEILDSSDNKDNKKSIILFSDGEIDVNDAGRTIADSQADINKSIEKCNKSGYSIYTVGLFSGNKSIESINTFESQMKEIAENTSGEYIRANNVNDLPKFFSELLQTLDGIKGDDIGSITANGEYQTVEFEITNSNVLEANIIMLHDKEIKDVKIINPSGKEVKLSSEDIVYTKSSKYTLIKISKPEKGKWEVKVKGISGDQINISLVSNYDLELVSTLSKNSASKGDKIQISANFNYENKKLEDKDFYGLIEAKAIVRDSNNKEKTVKLNYKEDGYKGEITLNEYGNYYVTVHAEGEGMDKYSEEMKVLCENQAPVVSDLEDKMTLKIGTNEEIDLAKFIKDPEGEKLTFNVSNSNDEAIDVRLDGSILKIASNSDGKSEIEIIARDQQNKEVKFVIAVDSYNPTTKMIKIGGGIGVLIAVIVIAVIANKKSKMLKGQVTLNIDKCDMNSFDSFAVYTPITLSGNKKSLKSILANAQSQFASVNSQDETMKLQNTIAMISSKATKVEFTANGKKGDDRYNMSLVKKGDKTIGLIDMSGFPKFDVNKVTVDASKFDYTCGVRFKLNNSDSEYVEVKMTVSKPQVF